MNQDHAPQDTACSLEDILGRWEDADSIDDPALVSPDFERIAGDLVDSVDWRLVDIPVDMLFTDEELVIEPVEGESPANAELRWDLVRQFYRREGGPDEALRKSPVIALIHREGVACGDGWHRCVVAVRDYGARSVTALLGRQIRTRKAA